MSMSMALTDRRAETRVPLRVPLQYRPVTDPPSGQQTAETVNLSQQGMCLLTATPLPVGSQVEVYLKMPSEISGKPAVDARCVARVMHVRRSESSGKSEVGLRVERYETIGSKERWTS